MQTGDISICARFFFFFSSLCVNACLSINCFCLALASNWHFSTTLSIRYLPSVGRSNLGPDHLSSSTSLFFHSFFFLFQWPIVTNYSPANQICQAKINRSLENFPIAKTIDKHIARDSLANGHHFECRPQIARQPFSRSALALNALISILCKLAHRATCNRIRHQASIVMERVGGLGLKINSASPEEPSSCPFRFQSLPSKLARPPEGLLN